MPTQNPHINIFIAYSRKDRKYLDQLRTYLMPLEWNETIKIWDDGEIIAGMDWEEAIKKNLETADIILLLVSANSIASKYFYKTEMAKAIQRHQDGTAVVIPVILRACPWTMTPLKDLQALPKDGTPITQWTDDADAYTDIVNGINRRVELINGELVKAEKARLEAKAKKERERAAAEKARLEAEVKEEAKRKEEERLAKFPEPIQDLLKDMVLVKGGTFKMGSTASEDEQPVHDVSLDDFKIGKYQITQAQWLAVMGNNPAHFKGNDKRPVENVSWNDTQNFIKKLNQLTGETFHLPTEAQWEFAARGGVESKGYKYAGSDNLEAVAWYRENSYKKGEDHPDYGTHPVGEKAANELDLYDMSGNVWEWCNDWYDKDYYKNCPKSNPKGPDSAAFRVLRGGSWYYSSRLCRSSYRDWYPPLIRFNYVGFRLAETP